MTQERVSIVRRKEKKKNTDQATKTYKEKENIKNKRTKSNLLQTAGNLPHGVLNAYKKCITNAKERQRAVIMTLNVDSLISNKETLGMYVNDGDIHVIIITESNVTESKLPLMKLDHYTIANCSCREDNMTKGGGGGGSSHIRA